MKDIAALIALASVVLGPALYGLIRRYLDRRTIARLRADVAVEKGRADTAEAQAHAVEVVAERRVEGERAEAAVVAAAATAEAAGDEHPERAAARERVRLIDARRAADKVRAKIARRKQ